MLRILLADDHELIRMGLRRLLEAMPDISVVAEAADGRQALELARQLMPDLAILDISMPGLDGIEVAGQLGGIKVIMLSVHADRQHVAEAFRAGASGYVVKHSAAGQLRRAIEQVMGGNTYLSPEAIGTLVEGCIRQPTRSGGGVGQGLTSRERDVLRLLASGKASKEIASILFISPRTVETHRGQIMDKLGLRSVAELTKYSIREGLTSLE